jgi:hypothetical protein
MARPRIFVSSTYYDLKHLRASIENFIESLGYDSILSEKGAIAYSPDVPLDESCYREVRNTDVFVLVIGGRYGSERSGPQDRPLPASFFDRYDSVTKMEYRAAVEHDIPIYIFVERAVYAEYQTFLRNKAKSDVKYAHVDSVNVFLLLEEILARPRNNPVKEFDRYEDIEVWLREQWAGLFKDLLQRTTGQKQLASLQQEVANLAAIGNTLQSYLEALVKKVSPQRATTLIGQEQQKLERARQQSKLRRNTFVSYLDSRYGISVDSAAEALLAAKDFDDLAKHLGTLVGKESGHLEEVVRRDPQAQKDANDARHILGVPPLITTAGPVTERIEEGSKRSGRVKKMGGRAGKKTAEGRESAAKND